MSEVSHWALGELLAKAPRAVSDPHVDLSSVLGTPHAVRVGLSELSALLESGEPTYELSIDDTTLTVRRQDGGVMGAIQFRF